MQVIEPREVPLGGLRALTVRRTLPHRDRSFIGAWCFVDHYGPTAVCADGSGRMDVAPHPHTGLQTVSWLFQGEIEHRDSGGFHAVVRPGEVNLMTAGRGVAHSEVSTAETAVLHGVQLWVALPEAARHTTRTFEHNAPPAVLLPDQAGQAFVFLGDLAQVSSSPVQTFTPLLGAQLDLVAGADVTLRVDPSFEHGVLLDDGEVSVDGVALAPGELACRDAGSAELRLSSATDGRLLLLGGPPFEEEIIMWWNFVGRSHEEIVRFREEWETGSETFGGVEGYVGDRPRIPAPALPAVRLRPRGRRGRASA
ncbi:pirin family protein [Nostocoides veronense]|uniref:Pirin family protein n=1 Tax=Nostocoides veronense TaxID=330836 RepID=A0ABN2LFE7_9MICO